MKPTVILTNDDVGTRSTPPADPAPSTSQATRSLIEPRTIASHRTAVSRPHLDFSKTPGWTGDISHQQDSPCPPRECGEAGRSPRKESEVKRNAGCANLSLRSFVHRLLTDSPAARQHSPVTEARRVGARHRVTRTCTRCAKRRSCTLWMTVHPGTSTGIQIMLSCPLVRVYAHASRHASSSTSQMATRDL